MCYFVRQKRKMAKRLDERIDAENCFRGNIEFESCASEQRRNQSMKEVCLDMKDMEKTGSFFYRGKRRGKTREKHFEVTGKLRKDEGEKPPKIRLLLL